MTRAVLPCRVGPILWGSLMRIRSKAEMATSSPKRLVGKHALKVCSLEDALGKLGSGKMTPQDFSVLQEMVGKLQGGLTLPSIPTGTK